MTRIRHNPMFRFAPALLVTIAASAAPAQQIVGGRALDANTRVDSFGLNSPSRAGGPGLSSTRYNPALFASGTNYNPGLSNPALGRTRAEGLQQTSYWTISSPSSGSSAAPTTRVYSGSPGNMSYNALAAPVYNPMRPGTVVQTGSSSLAVNGATSFSPPRYSALR